MLVDDEVYHVLAKDKADTQPIPTPNAMAMIALKLHAITQPGREDTAKDWSDVLALTKAHGLSLDDEEFSAIDLAHGGEVPSNGSAKPSLAEIDLPSGEGPVAHAVKFLDPRDVEAHFEGLAKPVKSAEERWANKRDALPFRW